MPLGLSEFVRSFTQMRADLASIGSELALSSFEWSVRDGMVVDPVAHKAQLENLNISFFPFRYRDMELASRFANSVFAKYATQHGLTFFDVAGLLPKDPDLFTDASHLTYGGVRLHAWLVLQGLIPLIEKRLAAGAWPTPQPPGEPPPGLYFTPEVLPLNCGPTP